MFKNRNQKIILFAIAVILLMAPTFTFTAVFGATTQSAPQSVTGICAQADGKTPLTLAKCVSQLYGIGITVVGIFAVLMIVVGAYFIMTAAGDTKKSALGREYIYGAIIGLVLALAAVLILQLLNPSLTNLNEPSPSILVPPTTGTGGGSTGDGTADGQFTYQAGIDAQVGQASAPLTSLMSCMATTVPGNVGQVSSISDSQIINGSQTFQSCAAGGKAAGCAHEAGSCHYGGTKCVGQSYAVDFGDEQNAAALTAAASTCSNGQAFTNFEGNHLHVSIGNAAGCGCN